MTDMAAKRTSISTKQLSDALAEQHQLTKKQGQQMLADLVDLITKHLKKRERVKIAGLGILQVRNRAAPVFRGTDSHSVRGSGKSGGAQAHGSECP